MLIDSSRHTVKQKKLTLRKFPEGKMPRKAIFIFEGCLFWWRLLNFFQKLMQGLTTRFFYVFQAVLDVFAVGFLADKQFKNFRVVTNN